MNILILSTHFNAGGITSYILTLAKGFSLQGHRVYVATSGGEMVDELTSCGAEHINVDIRTKSELSPKIYFSLGKFARLIREKNIDVIHAQTRVTQLAAALLSRMTGRAYLSTCHGFFKNRLARKIFPCWGERVIAISGAVRNHLINDFGVDAKKVVVIPHGLDLSGFHVAEETLKEKIRCEFGLDGHNIVGIIARLSEVKGHDVLIAAMKKVVQRVPDVRLLIMGKGRREGALQKMVRELGLEGHVRFYSTVGTSQMIAFLAMMDVFVMPSRQEGLGLSVMEAQAMGLPVVGSRVGGIPSLIEDGQTGLLISPGDVEGLSRAIIELLTDKPKARQIGLAARKFAEDHLNAERMISETLEVYSQIVRP